MTGWRLVSDIGGTNVRFARASGDVLFQPRIYPVSRHGSFLSALRHYVDETGNLEDCLGAAIGAAGPVAYGQVTLTNVPWTVSEAEVSLEIDAPCVLINDVEATALSVPVLSNKDFAVLGKLAPQLESAKRLVVVNVGTGFGAASLAKTACGWISNPSEAGHMSLRHPDGHDERFCQSFSTVEDALSGRGLCALHAATIAEGQELSSSDIFARCHADVACSKTLKLFLELLGDVLGNLALAVAAWDGVFLCGSVVKPLAKMGEFEPLRQAFEKKGPMSAWMRRIPIAVIMKEDVALSGLAALPLPPRT